MRKGTKSPWKFTHMPSGGYRFTANGGRTFEVTRDPADGGWWAEEITWCTEGAHIGCEHRTQVPEPGETFATRTDAAAACEWLGRDFWAWHDRYVRELT